ncbi:GNAT family N-acetyltransferase [Aliiglaciecola sp. LCG003]|uniref:GNAT family N-acetyltransferase n=1 Tax=Aliiglaciecola sp. LCG003 TaxID=3053655 RepID=UPI002572FF43|nr:GNAT family N-acetyltransferase [Aliiglaciecola sp. LCG003]WJG11027.1 N-acetyltransferase family protein [Aliiglaciecola sp. LCG003]
MRQTITIRSFEPANYPAVRDIYQQGINTGNATFQTKVKTWHQWNNSMLSCCRLVAIDKQEVLGWAALSAVSTREVYQGVAEVSVYVAEHAQGKGVGQILLSNLVTASENNNIWMLQASIFPENTASIALHKKNGFVPLGIREKIAQLNGQWRDVIFVQRRSEIVGI